jgi:MFS family permease
VRSRARAVLAAACSIHFVHDGFSDILYVLLPIWASEFRLTFAQVGIIRTAYSGGMAAFQIPAGLLAERWGERRLLAAGTAVTACGFNRGGCRRRVPVAAAGPADRRSRLRRPAPAVVLARLEGV